MAKAAKAQKSAAKKAVANRSTAATSGTRKAAVKTANKKGAKEPKEIVGKPVVTVGLSAVGKGFAYKSTADNPSSANRRSPRAVKSKRGQASQPPIVENIVARPTSIPEKQWELPAGFRQDGSFASLAEVVSDPVPTVSLESLSGADKKKLIVERIKQQTDFPTRYMLGIGEVNKERAIAEVESDSQAGRVIQESEQKLIQMLQGAATNA